MCTNHCTHFYGSTVIDANHVKTMINLTLEACVSYSLYVICSLSYTYPLTADLLCSMELAKAHLTCYCNTVDQSFLNALLLLDMLTFKTHLVTSVQLGKHLLL